MNEPQSFHTTGIPTASGPAGPSDLASALAALENSRKGTECAGRRGMGRPARRGILTLVLVVLLIGGAVDLVISAGGSSDPTADDSRASIVFSNARSGACLNWPPDAPDKPSFVQCRADHMFEVAKPVGTDDSDDACRVAVQAYLGPRYDPNGKFATNVLGTGDADGTRVDGRNLLCGLQLLGSGGRPIAFKGSVAELDQSKVWPVGTCLGVDSSNKSTDVPVDCTSSHGLEVTGAVGLAERFPAEIPAEPDQRTFLDEACTRAADGYLAPLMLATSGLALAYEPLSAASWSAGSRQVSCSVGRPGPQGGWAAAVGSARNPSPADVPLPASPPSTSDAPPPPVYQEPLVPIGPIPAEVPPPPASSSQPPPPPPVEPAPTETPTPTPAPTQSPTPQPGVLEIPGLPPIYLPGYVPPPAEPTLAPPAGPLPGPPP